MTVAVLLPVARDVCVVVAVVYEEMLCQHRTAYHVVHEVVAVVQIQVCVEQVQF